MATILTPTLTGGKDWKDIRKALRNCVVAVAPKAVVYSSWPLKYDVGQTINLLTSEADNGLVHAWIIRTKRAEPFSEKIGIYSLEWELDVSIWGFMGYQQTYNDATQDTIESEARAISQILFLNRKGLGMDDPAGLKDVGQMVWEDIDVQAFGSGSDVHVAQGNLKITLREDFDVPNGW